MQFLTFWLIYPVLYCLSLLPFRLTYLISDFVCFLVYRVFGYRKHTVRQNLALALPQLTAEERLSIEKKFFSYMCDMFLEMLKSMTMTRKETMRRFVWTNPEVLSEYEAAGKSVLIFCAHYASWEWLTTIDAITSFRTVAIYKKIANKYFDKLVHDIRAKMNAELIEARYAIKDIEEQKAKGVKAVYGFVADQSPQLTKARHWDYFMGLEVPVHTGGEMLAKRLDLAVAYARVVRTKRGFYEATIIPITQNPRSFPDFDITRHYLDLVEQQIYEAPQYYFWTHKRWKHAGMKDTQVAG